MDDHNLDPLRRKMLDLIEVVAEADLTGEVAVHYVRLLQILAVAIDSCERAQDLQALVGVWQRAAQETRGLSAALVEQWPLTGEYASPSIH